MYLKRRKEELLFPEMQYLFLIATYVVTVAVATVTCVVEHLILLISFSFYVNNVRIRCVAVREER